MMHIEDVRKHVAEQGIAEEEALKRDKDWPMIRWLVEAHCFQNRAKSNPAQISFWLRELRTPELILELAQRHRFSAATPCPCPVWPAGGIGARAGS